ncbi:hypothetical protein [Geobacillus sp. TFV-3]|uniref:hypothetical protein n=1 Tax=Geobacillus sp. TFV-3 TaxID=1897059 RepID=UPI0013582ABF|nr:hypothetical protein [Geobacillus sp. TFV-3]KAF0994214.1 hypothetical protein BJQ97_00856 [Geobacillus sp. TFV-3]
MAEIEERFKTLRYFVDGYYNQSIDDDEFDDRIRDFFTCLWAIRVGQMDQNRFLANDSFAGKR